MVSISTPQGHGYWPQSSSGPCAETSRSRGGCRRVTHRDELVALLAVLVTPTPAPVRLRGEQYGVMVLSNGRIAVVLASCEPGTRCQDGARRRPKAAGLLPASRAPEGLLRVP